MKRKPVNFTVEDFGRIYYNRYGEECHVLPAHYFDDNIILHPGEGYIYNLDRNEITEVNIEGFKYRSKGVKIKKRLAKKKWYNHFYPVYVSDNFYTDLHVVAENVSKKTPKVI